MAVNVKKTTLVSGVKEGSKDCLFLAEQVRASSAEAVAYRMKVESDRRFMEKGGPGKKKSTPQKTTCCTLALERGGVDGFVKHLSETLKKASLCGGTVPSSSQPPMQDQWPKSRMEKLLGMPMKERADAVLISMNNERLYKSGSESGCQCKSCFNDVDVQALIPQSTPRPLSPPTDDTSEENSKSLFYLASVPVVREEPLFMTSSFAMIFITFLSMLSFLPGYFLGVSCPAAYVGVAHSLFNFHIEAMGLWSFNFIHHGAPKFWIIVPPAFVRQVDDLLAREGFGGMHKFCSNWLLHKCFFILPQLLRANRIPYSIVIQREGEGIIILPNAGHCGANLGVNLAEACNIATKEWLPYGCVSSACTCMGPMVHSDLTTLLMKEKWTELLEAYRRDDVCNFMVDDLYFQQSILHPACRAVSGAGSLAGSGYGSVSAAHRKRMRVQQQQVNTSSCPVPGCDFLLHLDKKKVCLQHFKVFTTTAIKPMIVME
ncbi:hypothetical protein ONE63_003481 [Megalurothrips usitatus]|uniref:JmjC domain-containing protein n=1 Tax=Megalurothrips usitatus TaxID=439358 RepID=A0AAV7X850_9NEOP|nr:hypothetical protein ONE63_003481 [Megalurothrips usitatus]